MKKLFTLLGFLFSILLITHPAVAQSCTTGCTYTAPSQGTTFNLNGGQVLCITGNVTNLSGNFNGSNNQICLASGVTWTQTNALNLNGFSVINVYGTATLSGVSLGAATVTVYANGKLTLDGGSLNGTTITVQNSGTLVTSNNTNLNSPTNTIAINSGAIFQTSSTAFNNSLTVNNSGAVTFTSTGTVSFAGSATLNNAAGATVTATAPSAFVFGSGMSISNAGTMAFTNLENSDAAKVDNATTGVITISRRFYNHGAFKNDGLVKTTCGSGSGACEFRVGDKGAGKAYVNNACMIVAGDVIFDGPGTLNGTLEVLPGYNLTINKIVTGSNGYLLVDGGTSTINSDGQYTGSTGANSMKFYDVNTSGHGFDVNNNRNTTSVYEVLPTAPATSCSATASCSASLVVTSTVCQTATNQYTLTGTLSFANTGGSTYTISDGSASTTVATTGTSPQAFTLTGNSLVSTSSSHTLTATPSGSACSAVSTTYTSPTTCLTISVTSATVCAGQTATLTATGCIGSVSWNTGSTNTSINVTTSAAITTQTVLSYTAICTSGASSVTALGTVTVRPTTPAPTLRVIQPTCTAPTGSLTASSSGATSYTLSGPTASTNTTGVFTDLVPGSYTVTAGNGTPCTSTASTSISAAPTTPVAPTLAVLEPTCTTSTGSLTATSSGANAFTLSGPTTSTNATGIFTGLAPGSYSVVAGNGTCTSIASTTTIVANPGPPSTPTLTVVQPTCTTATGSLTATASGVTSYTLSGPTASTSTTGVFVGLAPGSYAVVAGNGTCTSATSTTTISAAPTTPAAPTLTVRQPDCSTPTGSSTAVSSGGSSYTLSDGKTTVVNATGVFSTLAPGSYTVIAGNGICTSTASTVAIIANPGTPSTPVLTVLQPNCSTPAGSLTAVSTGATSYTLSGGTTVVNNTGIFSALAPGSYTVLSSNSSCVSAASSATISANLGTPAAPTLTVQQPDCSTPTGSLTAVSAGSTSYTLTGGNTTVVSSTGIFSPLTPGSYSVTAGNSSCNSTASTSTINATPGTPAAPTLTVVQPDCATSTGSLTAISSGATSYTLSGATTLVNATGVFTGVAPGSYTVLAGNGVCTSGASTTTLITNPGTPATPSLIVVQPTCATSTGSLTAISAGATSYTLSNNSTTVVTATGIFTALTPGSYTVLSSNSSCVSAASSATISANPGTPATPGLAVLQPDCATPTGSLTATSSGATSYTLSSSGTTVVTTTGVFTGLAPGSYSVVAGNGTCTSATSTTTVTANPGTPAAPILTVVQPTSSTPTGSLTAVSSGATSYTLSGPITRTSTTGTFTNLIPGSYTVTAGNGSCISAGTSTTIVSPPSAPIVVVVQPDCSTPTGSLTATSSGATSYSLSGPINSTNATGVFTNLTPGSYSVVAGNGINSSVASTTTIIANSGTPATPILTVVQPNCNTSTGSLTATASGATSYTLSDGSTSVVNTTGLFPALAPGSYSLVAGNENCTSGVSATTIISNPGTPATPSLTVRQPDCSTPVGSLTAVSSGATSYTLTGGTTAVVNTTGIFTGLASGAYSILAGNGTCTSTASTTTIIANPGSPSAPALTVVQPTCTASTGSLTAVSAGANSYTLSGGSTPIVNTTGVFTNLAPGSYAVIAGNSSCSSIASTTTIIANPGTPSTPVLTVIQPDCSTSAGSLTAVSSGATSYTLNGPTASTNSTGVFAGLAPGSYAITAGNGACSSTASATVISVAPTVPDAPIALAVCSGGTVASGSVTITSPSVGAGITFSIDGVNYQADNLFTNLAVGIYSVTVRQNGCTSLPTSITVGQCPPPLPVGLVSFSGKWVEGTGNQLTWRTAWERSNNYFDIQRSDAAQAFESIGRVEGRGTTSATQTYAFVDAQPISDLTYYRLKQVDTDGTVHYSLIIAVERGGSVSLELYPNPTSSELNLRLRVGQRINEVSIYDNTGYRVQHQVEGKTSVPVSDLNGGVYIIEVKTATGQVFRQRFVKQ